MRLPSCYSQQEAQEEEEKKDWDVFNLSAEEWQDTYRSGEFKVLMRLLKLFVYFLTFCLALSTAVLSKASLLYMTSAISETYHENGSRTCGNLRKQGTFS